MFTQKVPVGVENRASKTVPPQFYLDLSSVPGSGIGVFSKTFIPQYTWLGELEGIVKPYSEEETEEDHYEWVASIIVIVLKVSPSVCKCRYYSCVFAKHNYIVLVRVSVSVCFRVSVFPSFCTITEKGIDPRT